MAVPAEKSNGAGRSLAEQIEARGITEAQWHTLARNLYPGAQASSVLMVIKITYLGVEAPEWCRFVVYRWNSTAGQRGEYPVTVHFTEAVATRWDQNKGEHRVNSRWTKAPIQMLTKCAEAAALREAFPEQFGGEPTFEEMHGQTGEVIDVTPTEMTPADDLNAELGLS